MITLRPAGTCLVCAPAPAPLLRSFATPGTAPREKFLAALPRLCAGRAAELCGSQDNPLVVYLADALVWIGTYVVYEDSVTLHKQLEAALAAAEESFVRFQGAAAQLEAAVTRAKTRLAQADTRIAEAEAELVRLKTKLARAEVQLAQNRTRLSDLRAELGSLRGGYLLPSAGLLRAYAEGLGGALLDLAEAAHRCPVWPVRAALGAALAARNAAIEGDVEAVDRFSRNWLGLAHPERWRTAVEAALLGDWVAVLGRGTATDPHIQALLRRHADAEHQALQPLWERKVRGKRTVLISQPLTATLTVQDLLAERGTPESEVLRAELGDSRLTTVLRGLTPEEAAVAYHWAAHGDSWARAALATGRPSAYGERVRRKLKRLGERHTERAATAHQFQVAA
ncbi:hypothetical protein [Streptomyces sp. HUAS TT7]|uniref:hypothetical protein n=1 Tax=Streptomyces sp. HUAS TT7 TaxID=3447507 RepID=UPI003F6588DF